MSTRYEPGGLRTVSSKELYCKRKQITQRTRKRAQTRVRRAGVWMSKGEPETSFRNTRYGICE